MSGFFSALTGTKTEATSSSTATNDKKKKVEEGEKEENNDDVEETNKNSFESYLSIISNNINFLKEASLNDLKDIYNSDQQ